MVEILLCAFYEGKFGEILIVVVLLENDYIRFGDGFDDPARDRRLSRPCPAANSNYQRPNVEWSNRASLLFLGYPFLPLPRFSSITACAAAKRAIGTQKGVALT